MSTEYDEDQFERDDSHDEKKHLLKLTIDFLTAKDFKMAANVMISYSIKLLQQTHSFKSGKATPVGVNSEVKLTQVFASFEFQASKSELFTLLNEASLPTKVLH